MIIKRNLEHLETRNWKHVPVDRNKNGEKIIFNLINAHQKSLQNDEKICQNYSCIPLQMFK